MMKYFRALALSLALLAPIDAALAGDTGLLPDSNVWGNVSGARALAQPVPFSSFFDHAYCATQYSILQRGSSLWACSQTLQLVANNAAALYVGPDASNAAFKVSTSGGSGTGVIVSGQAAGSGALVQTLSSGTNEGLFINAKNTGQVVLGNNSTGGVDLAAGGGLTTVHNGLTVSTGALTVSAGGATITGGFTATGQVTYADMASAALATAAQYIAGTASTIVPASVVYTAETTTTYGTTTGFDFSTFLNTAVTLTGNITTMNVSNIKAGQAGTITFIQDGAGSHTTVWNSNFKFPGGATPSLSTAANAIDVLTYSCRSATFCVASLIQNVH